MNNTGTPVVRMAGPEWNRRTFLKAGGLTVGGVGLASWLAACGASGTPAAPGGTLNLRMPFLADMQVPDPDIMYEGEGVQVMESAYEGLVRYQPGSGTIIGQLGQILDRLAGPAHLHLHPAAGVKFHDGTAADAAAWVKSFERRAKVDQGPAYMVAGVVKTAAPDPTTFVVTLKDRNNAFMHYLACPWQPFAVSPTAVAKNAVGDDLAQEWLKTNDAGTGPYTFKEFVPGSHYTLGGVRRLLGRQAAVRDHPDRDHPGCRHPEAAAGFRRLRPGDQGFRHPRCAGVPEEPQFSVVNSFGGVGEAIWFNPNSGIFANKALRQAMLTALDRK